MVLSNVDEGKSYIEHRVCSKKKGFIPNLKTFGARAHGKNLFWFRRKEVSYTTSHRHMQKPFPMKLFLDKCKKVSYKAFSR